MALIWEQRSGFYFGNRGVIFYVGNRGAVSTLGIYEFFKFENRGVVSTLETEERFLLWEQRSDFLH